jgi:hypothetical protein
MHSLNMYKYTSAFISSSTQLGSGTGAVTANGSGAAAGGGKSAATVSGGAAAAERSALCGGGSGNSAGGGGAAAVADSEPRPPAAEHLYDLFGIAVHHGTMQNGHYTAFIRRQASWFHCDDASVTPATPKAVRSCKAYLLFYIRKAVC